MHNQQIWMQRLIYAVSSFILKNYSSMCLTLNKQFLCNQWVFIFTQFYLSFEDYKLKKLKSIVWHSAERLRSELIYNYSKWLWRSLSSCPQKFCRIKWQRQWSKDSHLFEKHTFICSLCAKNIFQQIQTVDAKTWNFRLHQTFLVSEMTSQHLNMFNQCTQIDWDWRLAFSLKMRQI